MREIKELRKAQVTVHHAALKVPNKKAGEQLQFENCDSKEGQTECYWRRVHKPRREKELGRVRETEEYAGDRKQRAECCRGSVKE